MNKIKNSSQGFTLLEVLVVVLIIVILAAIALPQYKKVILKSRLTTVKQNVKTLHGAMARYFLANNIYPTELSKLDIKVNPSYGTNYYISSNNVGGQILDEQGHILLTYYLYSDGRALCIAYEGSSSGNSEGMRKLLSQICKQETGKTTASYTVDTYSTYRY